MSATTRGASQNVGYNADQYAEEVKKVPESR